MIPNTFIIGAMKSATSALCDILGQHPEAFISVPKEPDFFSRDDIYARGLAWYESLFRSADGCKAIGEGSTSYAKQLQYPHAADRLARHVPEARLIYLARDPIRRIQSHWQHEVLLGNTRQTMEEFVRSHPEAIDISCYWKQINRYRDHFPDEQICVLFFEDYCQSVQDVVDQCCDFLGLSSISVEDLEIIDNRTSKRQKDIAPIRALRQFYWFNVQWERSKRAIPQQLQHALKRVLKSREGVQPPRWTPDLREWVQDQLADDNQRFLQTYGKPEGFWHRHHSDPADVVTQS